MNGNNTRLIDEVEMRKALGIMVGAGEVFEIRILEPKRFGRGYPPRVIYGYFDNTKLVAGALSDLGLEAAKGIYITLNPVNPALLARSHNKFTEARDSHTTADRDVVRRRWLFVDCDPKRPSGISASDEEKNKAFDCVQAVYAHLKELGWPEPVVADSGNGYHLLYRIELPAEDERVRQCLDAISLRFSNDAVSIDTTVCNAARIVKLYGTQSSKGDHCPDLGRPHRLSKMLKVPEKIDVVTLEQLGALIESLERTGSSLPPKAKTSNRPSEAYVERGNIHSIRSVSASRRAWDRAKVQEFIDRYLAECKPGPAVPYDGGFKWVLGICPFNSDHSNRSAVIVIKQDGTLGFKCHHDGCKQNNWKALRARFEPNSGAQDDSEGSKVLDVPGDEELVCNYGPPVTLNRRGEPSHVNQMFVAAKYARDHLILHEPKLNMLYAYEPESGLWEPKTEASLMVELGEAFRDMLNECGGGQLLCKRTGNELAQIVGLLKGMIERPDVFQGAQHVIHVGNGVLHLDGDEPTRHEFSPDYYSRNRSEICFDSNAKCPLFLNELLRPALSEEDTALLQRYAGQCLIGQNLAQKILLLRGTPAGGKSTLVNVLEAIIGIHNVAQLRVPLLTERFEIAGFVGKTLLSGKDVPGDFLNNKAAYMLKSLVGGDRLNAEQKNVKHRFEVLGEFNAIITSNSRLHVRLDADTGAWRRRLLIIDYERPPVEKAIPQFDRCLVKSEGPGILNWCIEGACVHLAELKREGSMQMTPTQIERVETLLSESDSVRQFVIKCVAKETNTDVTTHELLTAYSRFCDGQGWQAVTVRYFENHISDVMMEIHRVAKRTDIKRSDKNQRGFAHVCLREC